MKKILEDIFGVDEDGNLSIAELTAGGVWMQMLSDRPVHQEKDGWEELLDEYDLENYDPEEEAFLMKDLPEEEPAMEQFSDNAPREEVAEELDALGQMKRALRQAGFDAADVDMLYEDEIQDALEDAGLSWQGALELDSDALREELLYVISAGLSREMQLREDLLDAGLNPQELAEMSCEQREEALEDAGLEPFDYEAFDFQRCTRK